MFLSLNSKPVHLRKKIVCSSDSMPLDGRILTADLQFCADKSETHNSDVSKVENFTVPQMKFGV